MAPIYPKRRKKKKSKKKKRYNENLLRKMAY